MAIDLRLLRNNHVIGIKYWDSALTVKVEEHKVKYDDTGVKPTNSPG